MLHTLRAVFLYTGLSLACLWAAWRGWRPSSILFNTLQLLDCSDVSHILCVAVTVYFSPVQCEKATTTIKHFRQDYTGMTLLSLSV